MRPALLALLWATSATGAERCALLVAAQPQAEPAALEAVRQSLGGRCRFEEPPAVRAVLEAFDPPPSPEERTREALARAHARMRRFDVAGMRQALDEARGLAVSAPPTSEGRQLFVQLALQEVELLTVAGQNTGAQVRALRLGLAADPDLTLDEARASPAMVALLQRARVELLAAPRVSVRVESQPPGAGVWASGWRGETPLAIDLPAGPAIVWLARPGYRGHAVLFDAGDSAQVTTELEPLSDAERLRPLVDAVRQAPPDRRRLAALAVATQLRVDAIVVLEPGATAPAIYEAAPRPLVPGPAPAAVPGLASPVPPRRAWYKKAWPWIVIVASAAAAATAVSVGVVYGSGQNVTLTCCR
jgi:hypothetical protein